MIYNLFICIPCVYSHHASYLSNTHMYCIIYLILVKCTFISIISFDYFFIFEHEVSLIVAPYSTDWMMVKITANISCLSLSVVTSTGVLSQKDIEKRSQSSLISFFNLGNVKQSKIVTTDLIDGDVKLEYPRCFKFYSTQGFPSHVRKHQSLGERRPKDPKYK